MRKENALDMNLADLEKVMFDHHQPKYRAGQIFQWLHRGVRGFHEMSSIPLQLREMLSEQFYTGMPEIVEKQVSKLDGTAKYLLRLIDGSLIECVMLTYCHGNTLCVSSQVGCRMGCLFCASTKGGLVRHLTPGEMVGQILVSREDTGERISNIVIMGSGEPLDNYNNVIKFIRIINQEKGLNIGLRHVTLSTCGLVEGIDRLSAEGLPVTLSVSLHGADDETRKKLMPVAKKYKIKEVIKACERYISRTGRRVTIEYALVKEINDGEEDAVRLAELLKGLLCHVNLIPLNPVRGIGLERPDMQKVNNFKEMLVQRGIPVTVRREMGRDINGACGQLRAGHLELSEKNGGKV